MNDIMYRYVCYIYEKDNEHDGSEYKSITVISKESEAAVLEKLCYLFGQDSTYIIYEDEDYGVEDDE